MLTTTAEKVKSLANIFKFSRRTGYTTKIVKLAAEKESYVIARSTQHAGFLKASFDSDIYIGLENTDRLEALLNNEMLAGRPTIFIDNAALELIFKEVSETLDEKDKLIHELSTKLDQLKVLLST